MSTGLPIEIASAMKGQNYISFCRLDIDIHRYASVILISILILQLLSSTCMFKFPYLLLTENSLHTQKHSSCSFAWEKRKQKWVAWSRNPGHHWGQLDNISCELFTRFCFFSFFAFTNIALNHKQLLTGSKMEPFLL